ncbi:hypothetical protein EYF80_034682 [Liparis tanakae]|uniref:Uncharacterized protein n=1 Tax=Liparis tanakae TaxID=230148 RepID=A0A4Z2GN94_9TELE|nr:hypothetical protein EYF80_034682 [Liparis tanakae]
MCMINPNPAEVWITEVWIVEVWIMEVWITEVWIAEVWTVIFLTAVAFLHFLVILGCLQPLPSFLSICRQEEI